MRVFSAKDVETHLTYIDCIRIMQDAMIKLSSNKTRQMLRQILPLGADKMYGIMGGTLGDFDIFGSKLVAVSPSRADNTSSSHQGVVVTFDKDTLAPTCIADASAITAIRTASTSAMATNLLARKEASILTILGTGEQAFHHALAILEVRQINEIRIWGRSLHKAAQLTQKIEQLTGIKCTRHQHVETACAKADIICTVTSATTPILHQHHVSKGTHLNIVGSSFDGPREIDDALVSISKFIVDSKTSVESQGSEYRHALANKAISENHILGEIGEVASKTLDARTSNEDITIFKSLGHIVQDIAAVAYIAEKTKEVTQ